MSKVGIEDLFRSCMPEILTSVIYVVVLFLGNIEAYSAIDQVRQYQRLYPFGGETTSAFNYFRNKEVFDDGNPIVKRRMAAIETKDMMFFLDDGDDGQHFRTKVIQVIMKWEDGEPTREWFNFIVIDDPMTCTEYIKKHCLVNPTDRNRSILSSCKMMSGQLKISSRCTLHKNLHNLCYRCRIVFKPVDFSSPCNGLQLTYFK
jgi:hypothetical protein